jgi:hypothetical protein
MVTSIDRMENMFKCALPFTRRNCPFWILSLLLSSPLLAQNLDQLYMDSLRSKNNMEQGDKDKKDRLAKFITDAKDKGMYWKCKSLYIFYAGYVLIGAKDDGSDVGKPPFDLIGNYVSHNDFTSFTFPSLPYENTYELNVKTSELVIYRKTLNTLDKVGCTFLK